MSKPVGLNCCVNQETGEGQITLTFEDDIEVILTPRQGHELGFDLISASNQMISSMATLRLIRFVLEESEEGTEEEINSAALRALRLYHGFRAELIAAEVDEEVTL